MSTKYMIFSGFLGSGKTTAMIAMARAVNARDQKEGEPSHVAIIANDLGAKNLVDADYTRTADVPIDEIPGDCICYITDDLVYHINRLADGGAGIVVSDIPGCGVGALNHVYVPLKEQYPDDELIPELDKDVQRLQLISDRFSKIGSLPELKPTSLTEVIDHVADYMDHRTSRKVIIARHLPDHDVVVNLNGSLFEWVIENLCKNAVDAMGGVAGRIDITVEELPGKVAIEVADTGKGIKKKDIGNVFRPGFTTKKRGWGLGLSLAKRIIEEYHKGRIWVKSSEVGKGTTFRIEIGRKP